jgi:hypothetical protein
MLDNHHGGGVPINRDLKVINYLTAACDTSESLRLVYPQ